VEEELLDDEALEAEEMEEADDDDEDVPAVDTRSLLDSPDGSISHADLGQLSKYQAIIHMLRYFLSFSHKFRF